MFSESILAPTCGPAASIGEVGILIGQTGGTNVWILSEINWMIQLQDGQIIVQSASIVFRMNVHGNNITFNVREELHIMVDIPFAQAHTQIETILTVIVKNS